jgi:hypothetical protein
MREKMKATNQLVWNTIGRIAAVFCMNAMAIVGSSSLIGGIDPWKAAVLAGATSAATVIQKLAAAYADDGKITADEIDAAFSMTQPKKN